MFSKLLAMIRQVIRRMLPLKTVETVERIETPLSTEMVNALDLWHDLYRDQAPWLKADESVKSLNLPALIASEIARQVTLEVKWNITGKRATPDGETVDNPRSAYLKAEFEKLMAILRQKLEQGCAAGGMAVRPYPKNGHLYFGWTMAWSIYPVAFDDNGDLKDVIFRDVYQDGKTTYTRLERHTVQENGSVVITQRAFKSEDRNDIGVEVPLETVDQWKGLQPLVTVTGMESKQLFGWFKVAQANNVDVESPMGISVFHKAIKVIEQVDMQYSRLIWEYKGSELAIDVDPLALRPQEPAVYSGAGERKYEMPQLDNRLFRGVNIARGDGQDLYNVFSPAIRDQSLINGLNRLLMTVEDLTGLSRGTLSDAPLEARTATELRILRQRTYATIADNQAALEHCLRDVINAMDKFADLYNLAPKGEWEASFEWDDSILTDRVQEMGERLELMSNGIIGRAEMRQWYTGETQAQAEAAIQKIQEDAVSQSVESLLAQSRAQSAAQSASDLDNNPNLERDDVE